MISKRIIQNQHSVYIFILIALCRLSFGQHTFTADTQYLTNNFNTILLWVEDNADTANNGYIYINDPPSHYEIVKNYEPIPDFTYSNIPSDALYHTTEQFRGFYLLINNNLSRVYISPITNFVEAQSAGLNDEIPGVDKWFLKEISSSKLVFQYGWLYTNAWFAESLIDAYDIISDVAYIRKAGKILKSTATYIDTSGQWLRYTGVDPYPKYIGMSQSILMRVLLKYLDLREDVYLDSILSSLAVSYVHTTEGVYNHWSNSRVGEMIRDKVLDVHLTDYDRVQSELSVLYSRIVEFDGKIPYLMSADNPRYPDFRPTYQCYDTFLLSLMSYYSEIDIGFWYYFEMTFQEAIKSNYGQSFTNNNSAALYIHKSYGIKNDDFMQSQHDASFISTLPTGIREAVSKLQAIATLLQYGKSISSKSIPGYNEFGQILFQNFPNPFNNQTKISYYMPHAQEVSLVVYDILGREVIKIFNGIQLKGYHSYIWDASDNNNNPVPSGIYICRLKSEGETRVIKMVLIQ